MKPRIFIGSSGKAEHFAGAIHDQMGEDAECTVWTEGAFGLSKSTLDNLIKHLRDSDFGVFVFAPDDVATIKDELLDITRDNVVYEAGLFGGYLSPERCLIGIPRTAKIRIPSDLAGMTLGHYEDDRTDKNYEAAVAGLCRKIKTVVQELGLFDGHPHEKLRELAIRFECCHWIKDEGERVKMKNQVAADIDRFCAVHPVNKYRLLAQSQDGFYIALLSAIKSHPEREDCQLILKMQLKHLPQGFAYYRLMDAAEALKTKGCCNSDQLSTLDRWLNQLPAPNAKIAERIANFAAP